MAETVYTFGDVVGELIEVKTAMGVISSQLSGLPCKENIEKLAKTNEELIKINERFVNEDRFEAKYDRIEKKKGEKEARLFERIKFLISPLISSSLTLLIYLIVERFIKK